MDEAGEDHQEQIEKALAFADETADRVLPSHGAFQGAANSERNLGLFRTMFTEALAEDGLLVTARGMGAQYLLERFVRVFCGKHHLVIALGCASVAHDVVSRLAAERLPPESLPKIVTNETTPAQRIDVYRGGGVAMVTSRILVVDLLTRRLPPQAVAGMLVFEGHRVNEGNNEGFAIRLFREGNPGGFIKAFSSEPESLVAGFNKLDSVLSSLHVRQLFLWPRFHAFAQRDLGNPDWAPELVFLQVPMPRLCRVIQRCLVVCIDGCIQELKACSAVDADDVHMDWSLFDSLESRLRRAVDARGSRAVAQVRQVVHDIRNLKRLWNQLLQLDAVSFYRSLLGVRQAHQFQARDSPWLMTEAAEEMFRCAKQRVFSVQPVEDPSEELVVAETDDVATDWELGLARGPVLGLENAFGQPFLPPSPSVSPRGEHSLLTLTVDVEQNPKMLLLNAILREVRSQWGSYRPGTTYSVLIASRDELSSLQLRRALEAGDSDEVNHRQFRRLALRNSQLTTTLRKQWLAWRHQRAEELGLVSGARTFPGISEPPRLGRATVLSSDVGTAVQSAQAEHFGASSSSESAWKLRPVTVTAEQRLLWLAASLQDSAEASEAPDSTARRKRERSDGERLPIRRAPSRGGDDDEDEGGGSGRSLEESFEWVHVDDLRLAFVTLEHNPHIRSYLAMASPDVVVVYDPNLEVLRELEVYSAQVVRDHPVRTYFCQFQNSLEQVQHRHEVQGEQDAFEKLIHAKAHLAVPRRASHAVEKAMAESAPASKGLDAWGISIQDSRFSRSFGSLLRPGSQSSKLGQVAAGALGGVKDTGKRRVVVDLREFRSPLPSLLHAAGMIIIPATLEVGDYILSPDLCVERKSLTDLLGSLASGRLYTQCVAMTRCYETPVLLIEFQKDESFGISSSQGDSGGRLSTFAKLSLLTMHFPSLRIVWSRSPFSTVDEFLALKVWVCLLLAVAPLPMFTRSNSTPSPTRGWPSRLGPNRSTLSKPHSSQNL
jgi:DNA excision repair protein ERCC-4